MSTLAERIKKFENDIRAGRAKDVARELSSIATRRTPRALRLPLANLSRRCGLFTQGLRFLAPVVRDKSASPAEFAEYGMLLMRSDLLDEAERTFERVDERKAPEVLLFRAFLHFRNWREEEATSVLESYLKHSLDPYQRVVGELNLAAAYVGIGEFEKATRFLRTLGETARANSYGRILGNCLELESQIAINRGDDREARRLLEASARELSQMGTSDALYMNKWAAVLEARETRSPEPLIAFRERAKKSREWESVREADRHGLAIRFDEDTFSHLLFGTPFERYRGLVLSDCRREAPTDSFVLGSGPEFDLATGEWKGREVVRPGGLAHRLLASLLLDFYRPTRLGSLFAALYPGETFDVSSSPDRVHQAIRRLRREFEELEIPMSVHESRGDFSLTLHGRISIALPYRRATPTTTSLFADQLRVKFGVGAAFDSNQARVALGMARTTFQRHVNQALERKILEKIGERNATRYKLAG